VVEPEPRYQHAGKRGDPLHDGAIDAAVFAQPHSLHSRQVIRAAGAGKHVFMEKPLSLSVADAKRAKDAADKAGIVLAIGFNRQFHPSMGLLRDAVKSGRLGTLVTVVAEQKALHGITLAADHGALGPMKHQRER
jgi:predicted dehydrogenase